MFKPYVVSEPPEAPKQLDVAGVGTRWLEFRWDPMKVHVTHYVLQMCVGRCADWSNYTVGGSLSYTKISYLKPAAQYTTRVIAVNDFGSSDPSPNSTVATLEDGAYTDNIYIVYRVLRDTMLCF